MQKNLKGGYQLISLGMQPIEDITHIEPEVLKTTKRIVLTGISLDGKIQLPDKTVNIEYGDGDIIFKNVYGYDLTIDTTDGTTVVSEVQPSGGTKLYQHHLTYIDDSNYKLDAIILSNIATEFENGLPTDYISIRGSLERFDNSYVILAFNSPKLCICSDADGTISSIELVPPYSAYHDTVTEL